MGSPIPGSMEMPDVPDHFLMTRDIEGNGPADPAETTDINCWCGDPECRLFLATDHLARAAFWAALGALKAQTPVRHLGEHCTEGCFDGEGRKRRHA